MSGKEKSDMRAAMAELEARMTQMEGRLSALAEGILTHRDACLGHFVEKDEHARDLELIRDLCICISREAQRLGPGESKD